eukprot:5362239-Amphidinium_carterae.2
MFGSGLVRRWWGALAKRVQSVLFALFSPVACCSGPCARSGCPISMVGGGVTAADGSATGVTSSAFSGGSSSILSTASKSGRSSSCI